MAVALAGVVPAVEGMEPRRNGLPVVLHHILRTILKLKGGASASIGSFAGITYAALGLWKCREF